MPITLEQEYKPGLPVVKRTALAEKFYGAVVLVTQRNRLKRDEITKAMVPVNKADGKPKQELVVTCVTLPGTTSPVGLGEDEHVPEAGELVRLILKGKSFSDWISAKNELGRSVQVGDIVTQVTKIAQVYDAEGRPSGPEIDDQATLLSVPRGRSVGIYGPVTLREAKAGSEWITKAETAYHSLQSPISAETESAGMQDDDGEPPF